MLGHGFYPVCIYGDILGGRAKRGNDGPDCDKPQLFRGIRKSHAQKGYPDSRLGGDHPGPAAAENPCQQGQGRPVHNGGPKHLDGMGHADPTEKADGSQLDAQVAQPGGKGAADEQKRKPGGKPQKQHPDNPRLQVDAPALVSSGGFRPIPHDSLSLVCFPVTGCPRFSRIDAKNATVICRMVRSGL